MVDLTSILLLAYLSSYGELHPKLLVLNDIYLDAND